MDLRDLLIKLRDSREPSRALDVEIGRHFGYVETVDRRWVSPSNDMMDKLPAFTSDVDESLKLVKSSSGGISWEAGMGSAQVGMGKIYQASSPAIALCISAILEKAEMDRG